MAVAGLAVELRAVCRDVREDEPLRRHVSFRIGGPADVLVVPRSVAELRAVAARIFDRNLTFVILGQGSNVLIADAGIRGIVVKVGKGLDAFRVDGDRMHAQAGAGLPHLSRAAADRGLGGLEFAAGIPASIGGAVVMNAGAHGHDMAEVVETVRLIDAGGERELRAAELDYAYRTSRMQRAPGVVLDATLRLRPGDAAEIRARTEAWLRHRSETQPIGPPSSGCVFRNPAGDHAGRLIELAGGKGLAVGGARVSEVHANYIINTGAATAANVLALADKVKALVAQKFAVALEPEIKLLGDFSTE
ncbi:MAG TPA: UDP-N-acetylmuramate dehydrogenase [bacterium]|jgi:UDP-N-acetylmuramate dehydrogenase